MGYAESELVQLNIWDDLCQNSAKEINVLLKKKGGMQQEILEFKRGDTTLIKVESNVRLVKEKGKLVGVEGTYRDVTKRIEKESAASAAQKETERKLRNQVVWNDQLLNTTNEGYIQADQKGKMIDVNGAYSNLIGYDKEELIGMQIQSIEAKLSPEEVKRRIEHMVSKGKDRFETQHRHKSGRLLDLEVSVAIVEQNGDTHVNAFVRDITEGKKSERAIQYRLDLEKLTTEFTKSFVGVDYNNFDSILNAALEKVARFSGATRSSVFHISLSSDILTNTHEWCADPGDSQIEMLQNIPFSTFGWHKEELMKGKVIAIAKPGDYPERAKGEREWIAAHGFRALLFIPLVKNQALRGALGFYGEVGKEISWPQELKNMLGTLGSLMISAKERIVVEQALQESEKKYRKLFEQTADALLIVEGGDIIDCNQSTMNMLGYKSKDQLIAQHPSALSPERQPDGRDSHEKANEMMSIAFEKGSHRFEWEHKRQNGETFPTEVLLTALPSGENEMLHAVLRDITVRKQAEISLHQREKQLGLIYDSIGDLIFYIKVDSGSNYTFLSVNKTFLKATGLAMELVIGKNIKEVIPEPSQKLVLNNYEKAIREKRIVYWEETSQYPTGLKTGIVSIAPVFDDEGHCTNLVGSVHDITNRKQMEKSLEESGAKYRGMVMNLIEGFYSVSMTGELMEYNTEFVTLLKLAPDKNHNGLSLLNFWERENDRLAYVEILMDQGWVKNYTVRARKMDGEKCMIQLSSRLIRDKTGTLFRIEGTFLDITEREQAKDDLKKKIDKLERYNQVVVGRELRMVELKNEINELCQTAGLPVRYQTTGEDDDISDSKK